MSCTSAKASIGIYLPASIQVVPRSKIALSPTHDGNCLEEKNPNVRANTDKNSEKKRLKFIEGDPRKRITKAAGESARCIASHLFNHIKVVAYSSNFGRRHDFQKPNVIEEFPMPLIRGNASQNIINPEVRLYATSAGELWRIA